MHVQHVVMDSQSRTRGDAMTTIQAFFFGVMVAWTPSVVLLAFFLWRDGIGVRNNSEFGDQPTYPGNSQTRRWPGAGANILCADRADPADV